MKPISINEYLNKNNPWCRRLLGLAEFQKNRDIQQVENEYNLDKYARLLEIDLKTIEDYKAKEFEQAGLDPVTGEMTISFGDELFKTSVANMRNIYYGLIKTTLSKYSSKNICELGCGYGYNLSFLGENVYGGEYSKNAVKLARKLNMDVTEFNYYKRDDYNFIKPETTIFTAHSIEQIPDATVIIDSLEKQKDKINYIVHFEPTVIPERRTLLGLFRNKYMELNDYNRNLIEVLKNKKNVEILELNTDVFGLMPLNTSNLIVWKFKK
jgi:SAM-dependent methyltransferase